MIVLFTNFNAIIFLLVKCWGFFSLSFSLSLNTLKVLSNGWQKIRCTDFKCFPSILDRDFLFWWQSPTSVHDVRCVKHTSRQWTEIECTVQCSTDLVTNIGAWSVPCSALLHCCFRLSLPNVFFQLGRLCYRGFVFNARESCVYTIPFFRYFGLLFPKPI